ncbi:MAG: 4-hydroxy-tetrahydrodipicolinate reductase [Phycisphaerales bacterium JB064]
MHKPINILLVGASGAVGSRIDALAGSDERFAVIARIDRQQPHARAASVAQQTREIIVDFSHFSAVESSIELARERRTPLLVGTTALEQQHVDALAQLARELPVLVAPNTSVGCVVLIQMVQKIARALGENFLPSIVEWHREGKVDAPSGTANALKLEIMKAPSGASNFGPRAVASIRAGGIVGEHLVRFDGPDETIELVHKAHSRDLFARGALRAAAWLVDQKPGLYDMAHMLGLRPMQGSEGP